MREVDLDPRPAPLSQEAGVEEDTKEQQTDDGDKTDQDGDTVGKEGEDVELDPEEREEKGGEDIEKGGKQDYEQTVLQVAGDRDRYVG